MFSEKQKYLIRRKRDDVNMQSRIMTIASMLIEDEVYTKDMAAADLLALIDDFGEDNWLSYDEQWETQED